MRILRQGAPINMGLNDELTVFCIAFFLLFFLAVNSDHISLFKAISFYADLIDKIQKLINIKLINIKLNNIKLINIKLINIKLIIILFSL